MGQIDRKDFVRLLGGALGVSAAVAVGCTPKKSDDLKDAEISLESIDPKLMEYRVNPITGDKVSLLGYGCMRLPMKKLENDKKEVDQEAWNSLVDLAIQYGVNYFDTAPIYTRGLSEGATGIALSRHPREKYIVATKMSNFEEGEQRTFEGSVAIYRNSMKELKVDYIDYYLLHAIGMNGVEEFNSRFIDNGLLDFLLKEREEGRIKNLGWSFHGDVKVFDYVLSLNYKWDFIQIQLNYIDWKHAGEFNVNADYLYGELEKRGIPAVIMEPLLGGRLVKLPKFLAHKLKEREPEASLASWAFRYAGQPSNVLTVLSGMTYKEHLVDNLKTYSPLKKLTDDDLHLLESIAVEYLTFPLIGCTECNYCLPCPYGIDIPAVFSHYNKCINEGTFAKSNNDENYKEYRKAFLVGYDRSVPKLRQADHCISCGKCNPLCPQGIDIPKEMIRINTYVEHLKQNTDFNHI